MACSFKLTRSAVQWNTVCWEAIRRASTGRVGAVISAGRLSGRYCVLAASPDVVRRSPGRRPPSEASAPADKARVKRSKSQSSPSPGPKKPGRKPSASEQPTPKKARLEDRVSTHC